MKIDMNILKYMETHTVLFDGGMGTLLQTMGLRAGEMPEKWNISRPELIIGVHRNYLDAGSNIICANTFGANLLKFDREELENIIKAAIENARSATDSASNRESRFVALDIGPLGRLLAPFGDLDFEEAVSIFAETVKFGAKYGADLVFIETMNDSYETKAALLAVKENCNLPVFVSNAYSEDEKLMTGATPEAMVAMLEGMGADAIGINCSLGPKQMKGIVQRLLACASVPVIVKPNAGLPKSLNGQAVYDVSSEDFAKEVSEMVRMGARIVGGCCGTTPEYISALSEAVCDFKDSPMPIEEKNLTVVSSYAKTVDFNNSPVLIGERINPTGKKRFKQALRENDIEYVLGEGINQAEKGVHILDVNVGLPEIDEIKVLQEVVCRLQSIIDLPLQIDTSDVVAMEKALRRYNGKAMLNSVNGKEESMRAVFPLAKKYGGVIVALTLDENGIPSTVEGRVAIAQKIISTAKKYGIKKNDLIFDTLTMTVSADNNAAKVTLDSLKDIKESFGCHTSLGVSNVSFGLPQRDIVNSTFFALALQNGLSAAIMNPYSIEMMKVYYSYRALSALDDNCGDYIDFASNLSIGESVTQTVVSKEELAVDGGLQNAIIKGRCEQAASFTQEMLKTIKPLDVVNNDIIPALDIVGKGFEEKKIYLPQLLMSAEAAKSAFEEIKKIMGENGGEGVKKISVLLATVKGDIHDIGKNIVKLLLENYGYDVIDLGKDVPPEIIVQAVVENHISLVGLSALMTTTVPSMEETIKLLRVRAPWCKVIVGGAVLTQEYADRIGADKYAKDAMEAVRYAETFDLQ